MTTTGTRMRPFTTMLATASLRSITSCVLWRSSSWRGARPLGRSLRALVDLVDGEVRELIRRRGLDPFIDPGPVRVLVRDVVADYSERSMTSAVAPLGDPESVVRDVLDRVAGFGPLQRYLDDPEIEEIWVNEPGRVFVARRGRSELTTTILGAGELADLVERMLRTSGRRIDMSTPFVDAMMPDGSRLHVVIPVSTRPADTSARTQGRRRTVCEPGNNGYSSLL